MTLDLVQCPELLEYLEVMYNARREYPENEFEASKPAPTPQREWYFDDGFFGAMIKMQVRWYGNYSKSQPQAALREKLASTNRRAAISAYERGEVDYETKCLMYIRGSRVTRWGWLCEDVDIEGPPTKFIVYRGSDAPEIATLVVKAWLHNDKKMVIPHRGLSSWSFLEGNRDYGARFYFSKEQVGTLLVSEIAIENTFLDVFVDDAYFAHHGLKEAEVIVGNGSPHLKIFGNPKAFRVQVSGNEYAYDQREAARIALKAQGLWVD